MENLKKTDPEVATLVVAETKRQCQTLDLVPSGNLLFQEVGDSESRQVRGFK